MAADFNKPTTASSYTTFPTEIRDMFVALALMLDTTVSNVPTNAVRWSATNKRFERYDGTTWGPLLDTTTDSYAISVSHLAGVSAALYATLASPPFTGTPTAPTAAAGTNTTQLANCAFVQAAIANLVASSPAALDTLNELAAALGNDPNFATTITNALAAKQAAHANLSALSGIPSAADRLPYFTGAGTAAATALTAFARTLLDDTSAAAMLATLGAQAAATAINTSNIGSQSVNYAASAGNADTLDGYHAASFLSSGSFSQAFSASGYQRLPSGLIMQWGRFTRSGAETYVSFPITFNNVCFGVVTQDEAATTLNDSSRIRTFSTSQFTSSNANTAAWNVAWLAFGY